MTQSEETAWSIDCAQRERTEGRIVAHLALSLDIAWYFFDYFLAPERFTTFVVLRTTLMAIAVATLIVLRANTSLPSIRRMNLALYASVAVLIVVMLPLVGPDAYWAYVIGFSLVLWTGGLVTSWPVSYGVTSFSCALVAAVPAYLLSPVEHSTTQLVGAGFYLLSVASVCLPSMYHRRKLIERAFRASHQLERRNEELKHALNALQEAQARMLASEKLSALGRLLAGLSHEINNPVNVIANTIGPLREYVDAVNRMLHEYRRFEPELAARGVELAALREELDLDYVQEDFGDALDSVEQATDRIRGIHGNLRRFIRGVAPAMSEGDFNEGIRVTLKMIDRSRPEKVSMTAELGELPPFVGAFDQLNQVHLNLLQNALDAVGDTGGIRVSTRHQAGAVVMTVEDDGPGIPELLVERVFEPFFTTKEVGKGTGLGLSVCHQIVTAHEGTIELDRNYKSGTRFAITLPLRHDSQKARSAA